MNAFKRIAGKYSMVHEPELNSEVTANMWLRKKISDAQKIKDPNQREKALARWQAYAVDFEDLDSDPSTPENLLDYNKTNPNDIYSIDGYRLGSRASNLVTRGIYDMFPTRADRNKNSDLFPEYKRYLRKYLLPEERELHLFTKEEAKKFVHKTTVAERVRQLVEEIAKAQGFVISIPDPADSDHLARITQIMPQNRTAVLGKLCGEINNKIVKPKIMLNMYPQTATYDWGLDPNKYLSNKAINKAMNAYIEKSGGIKSLEKFGISKRDIAVWITEGAEAIGVTVIYGSDLHITKIVDKAAEAAYALREDKKKRKGADFKKRYGELYTGEMETLLKKAVQPWSVRKSGTSIGAYTRGGDVTLRPGVAFKTGPQRYVPTLHSSTGSSSSSSSSSEGSGLAIPLNDIFG
jgi:hypothetical protein